MVAATSSTMAPEPPAPNLGSPRVRAAMRVLGVLPQELEKVDPATVDGGAGRAEILERKRRTLVQTVTSLASKSPEASGKSGDASTSSMNNASFMEKVLAAEKANIERMAKMAQKDVQKIVLQELEAKLAWTNGQKKQQESADRMKALKKERDEKLKVLQKEALKRQEKSQDARKRADAQLMERSESISAQLKSMNDQRAAKIDAMSHAHDDEKVKNAEKFVKIAERQAAKEQEKVERREKMYDGILARDDSKLKLLEEQRAMFASHEEERQKNNNECKDRVYQAFQNKQQATETKYAEICERHKHAATHRKEVGDAAQKEFKTKNAKARSSFESRWERLKEEQEKPQLSKRLLKMQSMSASDSQLFTCSEAKLASIRDCVEHQGNHTHIVGTNRDRLGRARAHVVEQQLNKIEMMRERVRVMQDSKAKADTRRMEVLRNTSLEKMHFQEQVQRVRDAGPAKMVKLLDEIEMEPEATQKVGEILGSLGLQKVKVESD